MHATRLTHMIEAQLDKAVEDIFVDFFSSAEVEEEFSNLEFATVLSQVLEQYSDLDNVIDKVIDASTGGSQLERDQDEARLIEQIAQRNS